VTVASQQQPGPLTALTEVSARRPLLVVTDFDGTLSPIVADPTTAALIAGGQDMLLRLCDIPGVHVTVMSGRGYEDLAQRVGQRTGVFLVGSHGAEYGAAADARLGGHRDGLVAELSALLSPYEGAFLEIKPVSASVHTRRMTDRVAAARLREATVAGPGAVAGRTVKVGKEVVEIAVVAADKGVALRRRADEVGADAIVYLGDDVTDEDAFTVLGPDDVGIKVGDGPSVAGYRVLDSTAVLEVLDHLVNELASDDDGLRMAHWIDHR